MNHHIKSNPSKECAHIYFGSYLLNALLDPDRGPKYILKSELEPLWDDYVDFYTHITSKFKSNPKYIVKLRPKFNRYMKSKIQIMNNNNTIDLPTFQAIILYHKIS